VCVSRSVMPTRACGVVRNRTPTVPPDATFPCGASTNTIVTPPPPRAGDERAGGEVGTDVDGGATRECVLEPINAPPVLAVVGVFDGSGAPADGGAFVGPAVTVAGIFVGGISVLVGGIGVFVGGIGVFVGGIGVFVGGIGVFVGGIGVFVGGIGVLVGVAANGVCVGVSDGAVAPTGAGVSVGARGTDVTIGGTGVFAGVAVAVRAGVGVPVAVVEEIGLTVGVDIEVAGIGDGVDTGAVVAVLVSVALATIVATSLVAAGDAVALPGTLPPDEGAVPVGVVTVSPVRTTILVVTG